MFRRFVIILLAISSITLAVILIRSRDDMRLWEFGESDGWYTGVDVGCGRVTVMAIPRGIRNMMHRMPGCAPPTSARDASLVVRLTGLRFNYHNVARLRALLTNAPHPRCGDYMPTERQLLESPYLAYLTCRGWVPVTLLAAWPAFGDARVTLRHFRRKRRGACLRCGYNLTGNVSGVCPECSAA